MLGHRHARAPPWYPNLPSCLHPILRLDFGLVRDTGHLLSLLHLAEVYLQEVLGQGTIRVCLEPGRTVRLHNGASSPCIPSSQRTPC